MTNLNRILVLLFVALTSIAVNAQQTREDRISIFNGIDLFNAIEGGKTLANGSQRNPHAIDFKGGAAFNVNYWEAAFYLEIFPTIDYYAMGMQLSKDLTIKEPFGWNTNFSILPGAEMNIVSRNGLDETLVRKNVSTDIEYFNWALSLKLRVDEPWHLPIYIEGQGNMTYRHDIIHLWGREALPSGTLPALWDQRSFYLSLGFYLTR